LKVASDSPAGLSIVKRFLALVVVALLAVSAQAEDLYKWLAADGSVHYSDTAPPKGVAFERVHIESAPVIDSGENRREAINWRERDEEFKSRRQTRLDAEAAQEARKGKAERETQKRCDDARKELDLVVNERRRVAGNASGVAKDIEYDEGLNKFHRARLIGELEDFIKASCR
jgi:hypothetical protein